MPSRKQIRRQQKLKRHEYEEVYVDEEGRELDPEEAEELLGAAPPAAKAPRTAKAAKPQPAARGARVVEPPSLRRTVRRGLLFVPLMLITVILLGQNLTLAQQIAQTVILMAFFLPFSYFMDSVVYRSYQRRLARDETRRRASERVRAAVVALAGPRREQQEDACAVVARERVALIRVEAEQHSGCRRRTVSPPAEIRTRSLEHGHPGVLLHLVVAEHSVPAFSTITHRARLVARMDDHRISRARRRFDLDQVPALHRGKDRLIRP